PASRPNTLVDATYVPADVGTTTNMKSALAPGASDSIEHSYPLKCCTSQAPGAETIVSADDGRSTSSLRSWARTAPLLVARAVYVRVSPAPSDAGAAVIVVARSISGLTVELTRVPSSWQPPPSVIGTQTVAVPWQVSFSSSVAVKLTVYTRPLPAGSRSARSGSELLSSPS